ncbi:MAG: hypothetical protein ACREVK_03095 [Gammaproteobacteria bacterium]
MLQFKKPRRGAKDDAATQTNQTATPKIAAKAATATRKLYESCTDVSHKRAAFVRNPSGSSVAAIQRIGRDGRNYFKNIPTKAMPASTTMKPKTGMEKINVPINGLISSSAPLVFVLRTFFP